MEETFFEKFDKVQTFISQDPSGLNFPGDLEPFLAEEALARHMWQNLKRSDWLEPLVSSGVLGQIPPPIQHERGIAFPLWPAGEYLERVAASVPDVAFRVIMEAPETENLRAHDNLVGTAIALPADLAAEWAIKESDWIARRPYIYFGLSRKLGQLISHLAHGGQTEVAVGLAERLLTVSPDPEAEKKLEEGAWFVLEPRARFDLWEYGQVLKHNMPDLVSAATDRALSLLCDLLDKAIQFTQRSELKPPEDLSHIWRPAIEDHGQNLSPGLKQSLVTAVRDAALQLVQERLALVSELVQVLEERGLKRRIFSRIALFLLRTFPDAAPELIRERLITRELFNDPGFRHEYFLLAQECFGRLNAEQQAVVFGWITEGPDVEAFKKWRKESIEKDTSDEEVQRYREHWQLERLKPLETYLQGEWKQRYSKLVEDLGQPEHPEFTTYISGGSFGPISPESEEDLGKMTVEDLVSYLTSWQPSGDLFHSASPEGLGRQISSLVASRPDFYSEHAEKFKLEEPTYVRSFIQGFQSALREGRPFAWEPVVDVCKWAAGRPREIPGRTGDPLDDRDKDWGSTRIAIARFFSDAFDDEKNPLPFSLRYLLWEALEPITSDPDPDPKSELRYLGGGIEKEYAGTGMNVRGYDPVTHAMNSVRGEAISCVVKYALWVRRFIEHQANKEYLVARGFDGMPEVRAVLDEHLNTDYDPSIAIRSVYGERFPWIHHLDARWATANAERIFPASEHLQQFRDAAWESYIVFNRPYDAVLKALEKEYSDAVERLGEQTGDWERIASPGARLAEHLMTFYWWGTLNLDSPLVIRFYEKADPKLRGHALEFIGRSFRNAENPIPDEVIMRAKMLWEARLDAVKKENSATAAREELSKFGWWFVSRKFDEGWAVRALAVSLKIAGYTDMPNMVIEYLAELAPRMPSDAMDCLYTILSGENDDWRLLGSDEKAKEIIRVALKSGKEEIRRKAIDLVNLLGSRGYFDFGEVLKEA